MNSKIIPRFYLSHSVWRLLFSPLLSSLILFTSIPYLLINPLIEIGITIVGHFFFSEKKTVAAIAEFINSNQPVSFSSHALMLKRTDIKQYPVSWSSWYLFHLLLWYICLSYLCLCKYFTWWQLSCHLNLHILFCWSQQVFTCVSCDLMEFPC